MCSRLPDMHGPGNVRAYLNSYTMCSTQVVYLSLVWDPLGLCTLTILLNLQVNIQSLATMQLGSCVFSMAPPAHQKVVKHRHICSVLKNGRAFLGTLALDSNCIVWCTSCVVFIVGALSSTMWYMWMTALSPFFFPFSLLFLA